MYAAQSRGLLGNYLPTWGWDEFLESGIDGSFGFRHRTSAGSPLFRRGFDRRGIISYVRDLLLKRKINVRDILISQDTQLYDDARQLQGEVARADPRLGSGMVLTYSGSLNTSLTCREEVRQSRIITLVGLRAKMLLQEFMDWPSYDFLQEVLERYPDAVVEFTTFSRSVGILNWNCIFWEVRNY
jgi:hypothetical protein